MNRRIWLLFALAVAMRVLGCVLRPIPSRDGVAYLWLAEQWRHGDLGALFDTVFHPLYPFVVGSLLHLVPALDATIAGQIVAAGSSAFAVPPLWLVTRRLFDERAATWACVMFAIGTWFVRHPAECLTEGPFHLTVLLWAALLVNQRPRALAAGLLAGAAFLLRPEGAALALAGMLLLGRTVGPRAAAAHALGAAAVGSLLPLGSLATGHGFVLTPKAAFNYEVGVGRADSPLAHYLHHLLHMPGDAWEGLGYVAFPLMLGGIVWRWRRRLDVREVALLLPFALQCAVFPLLRSNLRFVSGFGVLLLPFAGLAFAQLLRRERLRWLLLLLLFAAEAKLWLGRPADRTIERGLGRWLSTHMAATDTLASDMPRLWYFAGRRPPPPREITADELIGWAREPSCRYVALRRGRNDDALPGLAAAGFVEIALPRELTADPTADEVWLFGRAR